MFEADQRHVDDSGRTKEIEGYRTRIRVYKLILYQPANRRKRGGKPVEGGLSKSAGHSRSTVPSG